MTKENIKKFCKKYNIIDYNINDDLSIDVNHDVEIDEISLYSSIPVIFNNIKGNFTIHVNIDDCDPINRKLCYYKLPRNFKYNDILDSCILSSHYSYYGDGLCIIFEKSLHINKFGDKCIRIKANLECE